MGATTRAASPKGHFADENCVLHPHVSLITRFITTRAVSAGGEVGAWIELTLGLCMLNDTGPIMNV